MSDPTNVKLGNNTLLNLNDSLGIKYKNNTAIGNESMV